MGGGLLGAVEELVGQHNITRPVFGLERADGADANHPGHAELLHPPDVGAVVQFARQNPVATSMPGQEYDLAPRQLAGEKTVRGRAEGRLDIDPLLLGKAFDMIQPTATDDADTGLRHAGNYSGREGYWKLETGVNRRPWCR